MSMVAKLRPGPVCGPRRLKIDIVVQGRFHAFALARALIDDGHDVLVHTNYPAAVVARFGLPRASVRSFVTHGITTRIAERLEPILPRSIAEPTLHRLFARWAARQIRDEADIVYGFSGVMEEVLRKPRRNAQQVRTLVRGSAHILDQARLLMEEEARAGVALDRPTDWRIDREMREYALADYIFTLSAFAHESFLRQGVPSSKILCNPLGVSVEQFRADEETLKARTERILARKPLRVLNVGTFSYQKGMLDFIEIASRLSRDMQFRFVGTLTAELEARMDEARRHIEFVARVPERELAAQYAWADVFLFPTIQDGFAAVLLQAAAAGLPVIATANCSAPDFVKQGETGWVVPIRSTDEFIDLLKWSNENRPRLVEMARACAQSDLTRSWQTMAREMIDVYETRMVKSRNPGRIRATAN